ncbi:nucleotidyltransferase family protein [uncultured Nevskia sp.]|uniref:nucleotidyltransferase family protein n=1 Tax=uncultured Nevskia sp. TaxID=228950 RepID=UPI0025DDA406|nr:nucleotidyltransferase family protein [uncultured Nevskia sp.]
MNAPNASPVIMVMAAGASTRYGSAKQLARLPNGCTLVRHAAVTAIETGLPVQIVIGAHGELVRAELIGLELAIVDATEWWRGVGRSIAQGVDALVARVGKPTSVLLTLADLPQVTSKDLLRLAELHRQSPDRLLVSGFGDNRGPPCLFPADCLPALQKLDSDDGARGVVKANAERVIAVPLAAAGFDIDRPSDLLKMPSL